MEVWHNALLREKLFVPEMARRIEQQKLVNFRSITICEKDRIMIIGKN
jgi:hypothetical protein